jgi:hypothetical protein
MRKTKLLICLAFVFLLSLGLCSCTVEKDAKEYILTTIMPEEYTVEQYDSYLPSSINYYDEADTYRFTVTYETDSDLIEIEEPVPYPYPNSLEDVFGKGYYNWRTASKYKVKLSDESQRINVKCTYRDEENDIEFVIDRVFILLNEIDYTCAKLGSRASEFKNWTYSDGIYSSTAKTKQSTTISSSHKVTTNTAFDISYNSTTGDIYCTADSSTFVSKGWENTTTNSHIEYVYNIHTGSYVINGEPSSLNVREPIKTVVRLVEEINNDKQQ